MIEIIIKSAVSFFGVFFGTSLLGITISKVINKIL